MILIAYIYVLVFSEIKKNILNFNTLNIYVCVLQSEKIELLNCSYIITNPFTQNHLVVL